MIDQAKLHRLFNYDPETGWLTNKVRRSHNADIGMRAGTIRFNDYRQIHVEGSIYLEHRLIWLYVTGEWPIDEIDHINGIRDDNSWKNLREASRSDNRSNAARSVGTSGLRGVSPNKYATKWRARVWVDGQEVCLGEFDTKEEAAEAYNKAAESIYGEFAYHNRPQPSLET